MGIEEDGKRFDEVFLKMDRGYERYAKSFGMNYSSLALFQFIWEKQPCTQKYICEITMLPKQTVNSIVMSFVRQGYLQMLELPDDRRHKALSLSDAGTEFANRILPKIKAAENQSIAQFSEEERRQFLSLLEKFSSAFSPIRY